MHGPVSLCSPSTFRGLLPCSQCKVSGCHPGALWQLVCMLLWGECVELFPSPGSCCISCPGYFVLPLLGFPFTFMFSGVLCLLHFSPPLLLFPLWHLRDSASADLKTSPEMATKNTGLALRAYGVPALGALLLIMLMNLESHTFPPLGLPFDPGQPLLLLPFPYL